MDGDEGGIDWSAIERGGAGSEAHDLPLDNQARDDYEASLEASRPMLLVMVGLGMFMVAFFGPYVAAGTRGPAGIDRLLWLMIIRTDILVIGLLFVLSFLAFDAVPTWQRPFKMLGLLALVALGSYWVGYVPMDSLWSYGALLLWAGICTALTLAACRRPA